MLSLQYGFLSSVTDSIERALSSTIQTFATYGIDLLRFAVDNPVLFVLSMTVVVALVLFTRLH